MDWGFLFFLAEPWFVIPWYLIGIGGSFLVIYDLAKVNTPLKPAMKWAWPIIVLFFSILGLALYYGTARAPGIGRMNEDEKKQAHDQYEASTGRRVNGAVIHCIAGDGLGIMTAMVIARAVGMNFWQEFWFEYLVGFLFGWFIFQYRSMSMMAETRLGALGMAFRGEFWSMLTVMGGMGAVMGYVTPLAVTEQPKPLTYAFWGFGMFGLLVGYVFTWPMNWMMVKIGWKHGMGGMKTARQLESNGARYALLSVMAVLGAVALVVPAWLVEVRDGTPLHGSRAETEVVSTPITVPVLARGLEETVKAGLTGLDESRRSHAAHAVDAAYRAAEVARHATALSAFDAVHEDVKAARRALHMGREDEARAHLEDAAARLDGVTVTDAIGGGDIEPDHDGALVLNPHGIKIGEVESADAREIRLFVGGARNVWGVIDAGEATALVLRTDAVAIGPARDIGSSMTTVATE